MPSVLIHGATNCGSSNYGDFIYVDQLASHIEAYPEFEVFLAQPSEFFLSHTCWKQHTLAGINLLVYAPGGYFGEGHAANLLTNMIHFLRFMPIGLRAALKRIPIVVVGIGAGPNHNHLLSWSIRRIASSSVAISVRDKQSADALLKLGCDRIQEYPDMILAMDVVSGRREDEQTHRLLDKAKGKKLLLIHYNHSAEALEKFAVAASAFLRFHPDYIPIVCYDQLLETADELFDHFESIVPGAELYRYADPYSLSVLLSDVQLILTCKLHVGVVGAMQGASVLCFAEHPEKSKRFYEQIGYADRCSSLYESDAESISNSLELYYDKPISIPKEIISAAAKHWDVLDDAIEAVFGKQEGIYVK